MAHDRWLCPLSAPHCFEASQRERSRGPGKRYSNHQRVARLPKFLCCVEPFGVDPRWSLRALLAEGPSPSCCARRRDHYCLPDFGGQICNQYVDAGGTRRPRLPCVLQRPRIFLGAVRASEPTRTTFGVCSSHRPPPPRSPPRPEPSPGPDSRSSIASATAASRSSCSRRSKSAGGALPAGTCQRARSRGAHRGMCGRAVGTPDGARECLSFSGMSRDPGPGAERAAYA